MTDTNTESVCDNENLISAEIEDDVEIKTNNDYDTLVLSGGSTKGIITLGSLQYLYDNNYLNDVENFVGTSSGAIICFLLAIGYTPIEIIVYICTHQLLEKMQHFNVVAMLNGCGASTFSSVYEQLEKMTIAKIGYIPSFNDMKHKLKKNFICITYNITENKTEYLSYDNNPNMPCLIALRMSSNLPLVFENYKYGNNFYVDGGVCDNFPIDIGDKIGKKVLGIYIDSEGKNFSSENDINIVEFIYKLMFIPISQRTVFVIDNVSTKCKVLKLQNSKTTFFDFNINSVDKLNLFSSGYQDAKMFFES